MKGFFSGVWLGLKTLVSNPLGYLTDPIGSTTKQYQKDLEKAGATPTQIDESIKAYHETGGIIYDVYSGAKQGLKRLGSFLNFSLKNVVPLLLIIGVLIGGFYLLRFKKVLK